jgi:hypothetical protein
LLVRDFLVEKRIGQNRIFMQYQIYILRILRSCDHAS